MWWPNPASNPHIWWDANRRMEPDAFERLRADMFAHLQGAEVYVQDLFAGADPAHRLNVRVVTELPGMASSSATCCAARNCLNWRPSFPNSPS
jgi:ATP-dependent phosphoenolpyruvate carboxykinase